MLIGMNVYAALMNKTGRVVRTNSQASKDPNGTYHITSVHLGAETVIKTATGQMLCDNTPPEQYTHS